MQNLFVRLGRMRGAKCAAGSQEMAYLLVAKRRLQRVFFFNPGRLQLELRGRQRRTGLGTLRRRAERPEFRRVGFDTMLPKLLDQTSPERLNCGLELFDAVLMTLTGLHVLLTVTRGLRPGIGMRGSVDDFLHLLLIMEIGLGHVLLTLTLGLRPGIGLRGSVDDFLHLLLISLGHGIRLGGSVGDCPWKLSVRLLQLRATRTEGPLQLRTVRLEHVGLREELFVLLQGDRQPCVKILNLFKPGLRR
mmetsp:Transcript_69442/g.193218  ORF Transcript_69442/g.193218 Transcript_69442/m.193218 type:complete len:247 (-) Transcript_69442:1258-1998(-)